MYQFRFIELGIGEIQIDEFIETFESDHSIYSMDDYENQWVSASERLTKGLPAIFITSVTDPNISNFYRCWECYPINEKLIFHERLLFLNDLEGTIDINNLHQHILPYSSASEDGTPISEWVTKLK